MMLSVETLEKLVNSEQQNHQTKVDAGLEEPRQELTESLMHRLAEKAMHIKNFPNYSDHPGPCGCMGKERLTDPGCYCAMRGLLYERRFEVALFLAQNPGFAPVKYVPPNAVFIKAGQATLDNMKKLRAVYKMTMPEAKNLLTDGGRFPLKHSWELKITLDTLTSMGIDAELGAVDLITITIHGRDDYYSYIDWFRQNGGKQGNDNIDLANGIGNWMAVSVVSNNGEFVEITLNDLALAEKFRCHFGITAE